MAAAMASKRQSVVSQRRNPRQTRARATMEAIFEATARIIERDGIAALNTNRIAERAGVSIGTLYEYFPHKEAILIAMARQRLAEDERVVRQALIAAEADEDLSLARKAIHAMVALHGDRPKVRRAVMAVHLANGFGSEHARPVQEIAELIVERNTRLLGDKAPRLDGARIFVLTRAVIGVIRAAFEERSLLPGTTSLEDELVRLVEAYLSALQRAPASSRSSR
jgi:AcrR family transcriptional regulator